MQPLLDVAEDKVGGNTRPAHPHLRLVYLLYPCRACSSVCILHTLTGWLHSWAVEPKIVGHCAGRNALFQLYSLDGTLSSSVPRYLHFFFFLHRSSATFFVLPPLSASHASFSFTSIISLVSLSFPLCLYLFPSLSSFRIMQCSGYKFYVIHIKRSVTSLVSLRIPW